MAELDLSAFLKESSVSDLSWLDVDEEEYRKQDALPRQNLDIRPDLEALWAREGESPTKYVVPNVVPVATPGVEDPKTMGDMSQVHGRLRAQAEEIAKVARLIVMQTNDTTRLRSELVKRFGLEALRLNREVLASALQERGLLGRIYVAAQDFPSCDRGVGSEFVRKYASEAKFVVAKAACGGCCHAQTTATGGSMCGQFQKEIKVEIPYTDHLAATVEAAQAARGRIVEASTADPKERIRLAFLAPRSTVRRGYAGLGEGQLPKTAVMAPGVVQEQLVSAAALVRKKQAVDQVALDARPVIAFLHREMVKGLSQGELAKTLKLAFDANLLTRTHNHWGPLFNESGLYGVIYTKQASFEECRTGADFLAKHNPSVRAIVAGPKCGPCIYNKIARCLMYGKPLVKSASEVLTNETVEAVLLEHRTAGRLPPAGMKTSSTTWGETPVKALKAIHVATRQSFLPQVAPVRMGFMQGFHGQTVGHTTNRLTKRDIAKQASRYMNEGLYGQDLLTALKTRFEARDLVAAKDELKSVLAEQGLQGIYYVDPAAYDDYGKGCNEASRLHGTRMVGYLKEGSKCGSCVHQIRLGFCSKINKQLVVEPPYVDKAAQQREILASGTSTASLDPAALINNATNTVAEFQMQHELSVEVNAAEQAGRTVIQFGTGAVKL